VILFRLSDQAPAVVNRPLVFVLEHFSEDLNSGAIVSVRDIHLILHRSLDRSPDTVIDQGQQDGRVAAFLWLERGNVHLQEPGLQLHEGKRQFVNLLRMSAESGVPTYRGEGGIWTEYRYQDYACQEAFDRDPVAVWDFHDKRRAAAAGYHPHRGHTLLADPAKSFRITISA
jgi:hypothetical protein